MAITDAFTNEAKQLLLSLMSGDSIKVALYSAAATLDKNTTVYSATNEVTGTNWPAGGVALASFAVGLTGDVAHLSFADVVQANVTLSGAQGWMVYNASRSNKALAVGNFSNAPLAATAGTLTLDLPSAGAAALLRIA